MQKNIQFSRTHPLWEKSLKFYILKEKTEQVKTVITQGGGEEIGQMECHKEMELEANLRVDYASSYMKVGSLNTKLGAQL